MSCDNELVLRIGVAGGEQRFIFECPYCQVALRGALYAEPGELGDARAEAQAPRIELRSEDFEELPYEDEREDRSVAVTIYTDIPVPRALQGLPARQALLSPFIVATQICGMPNTVEVWQRIGTLRGIREHLLPPLRRAWSTVAAGNLEGLPDALRNVPAADAPEVQRFDPVYRLGRLTDIAYIPLAPAGPQALAPGELMNLCIECERLHGDAYQELLRNFFGEHGLGEHRRRVIETAMACLAAHDALIAPLIWEYVTPEHDVVDDYQVMRDDFEALGGRYQDAFELVSRTTAYLGMILNLWHRDDPEAWSDGRRRTAGVILNQTTAYRREFILAELPLAREVVAAISRGMRNQIGHRLVAFDFQSQTLVDDAGSRVNYLVFLVDYLAAVRATQYLMTVIEKLTLDLDRRLTPQREEAGLPVGP